MSALGYGRVLVADESLIGDFFESYLDLRQDQCHGHCEAGEEVDDRHVGDTFP